jgi:group I intron endonuclease
MKLAGVYAIVHVKSRKCYVGSVGRSFELRWKEHLRVLRKGKHHSILLQRAWSKHGEDAFEFRVEEATLPEHAVACEQVFIDFRKSADPKHGFNVAPAAGSQLGIKRSEATCKANADRMNKWWADNPEARLALSERNNRIYETTPDAKIRYGARVKKMFADNPHLGREHSARMKRHNANPAFRKANSDRRKQHYVDNPEAANEARLTRLRYVADHPEAGLAHGEKMKKYYENPEARLAASKRLKATATALFVDPVRKAAWLAKCRATRAANKARKETSDPENTIRRYKQ